MTVIGALSSFRIQARSILTNALLGSDRKANQHDFNECFGLNATIEIEIGQRKTIDQA